MKTAPLLELLNVNLTEVALDFTVTKFGVEKFRHLLDIRWL